MGTQRYAFIEADYYPKLTTHSLRICNVSRPTIYRALKRIEADA